MVLPPLNYSENALISSISLQCCDINEFSLTPQTTFIFPTFISLESGKKVLPFNICEKIIHTCKESLAERDAKREGTLLFHDFNELPEQTKVLALWHHSNANDSKKPQERQWYKLFNKILCSLENINVKKLSIPVSAILNQCLSEDAKSVGKFIDLFLRHFHQFTEQSDRFKSHPLPQPFKDLEEIVFIVERDQLAEAMTSCDHARAILKGIACTQQWANLPANYCNPEFIHQKVLEFANQYSDNISIIVHNTSDLEKMNMNGILGVAAGSCYPAYLLEIHYHPQEIQKTPPIVLVGKGITFDSGGLSLKPATAMEQMKFDMCGAATVFGVLNAVAELKLSIPVIGLLPVCENMVSQNSYRPGDILTLYSGLTVEILNTDAEGRLILADALAYAEKTLNPKEIIDIATLTGACVVALGKERSGLFSNNPQLSDKLFKAGENCDDKLWPMPMDSAYDALLSSSAADWSNCGKSRGAGAITAARFLSKFIESTPWAHLDIAGTAYTESGRIRSTGRPVAMLLHYLIHQSSMI